MNIPTYIIHQYIYSRAEENNLLHMPLQQCYITDEIIFVGILQRVGIKLQ